MTSGSRLGPALLLVLLACPSDDADKASASGGDTASESASGGATSVASTTSAGGTGGTTKCEIGCQEITVCEAGDCQPMCDCPVIEASCWADAGFGFPNFRRNCGGDGDCGVVEHYVGCCGPVAVLGLRAEHVATFEEVEADCAAAGDACDCAEPVAFELEDGTEYIDELGPVVAVCRESRCESAAG